MTDQTPTPEQEHPGKAALDRISRAYEELKAVIQRGGAPAIKANRAYVCAHNDWCKEGSHIPIAAYASELEARADAAGAESARLREALAPFVLALEQTNIGLGFDAAEKYASANMLQAHLTMKDFANARAALSLTTPDQEDQS